jgi:spermidine synthase
VQRLFAGTVFAGAALLFTIEPLTGRLVLPRAGGTPAVWTTCLLVFQFLLLAGYAYADAIGRLPPRGQVLIHLFALILPVAALPIALPADVDLHPDYPVLGLLPALLRAVGLPFFIVATTAPLLQRWYSAAAPGRDPYPLYAASNAGSLVGLAAYPFVIEPALGLASQGRWWAVGYGIYAGLVLACAGMTARAPAVAQATARGPEAGPMPWGRWLLLSFAPSSLLMSVTTAITTDITPVPLLWVVPLALYLITFIIAFAARPIIPLSLSQRLAPIAGLVMMFAILTGSAKPWWGILLIHLVGMFIVALACHGELNRLKPPASGLTRYYLIMSLGGLLGGALNALIAPLIFTRLGLAEYPLVLALALAMLPNRPRAKMFEGIPEPTGWRTLVFPTIVAAATAGLVVLTQKHNIVGQAISGILFGVPLVFMYLLVDRPRRFAFGMFALWLASYLHVGSSGPRLYFERNFFGPVRVTAEVADGSHLLIHGNTVHGRQMWRDGKGINEPMSYYGRPGPIGDVMREIVARGNPPVAVCGLGAGSMAAYVQPGQRWTFYEIDPAMVRIAKDPKLFTYLSDNFPDGRGLDIRVGDARLELAKAADGEFGLIVLDAFSSDSIPIHLITREAIELYRSKLAPGGIIAFHVSNRYLDLKPPLAAAARDLGMVGRSRFEDVPYEVASRFGTTSSLWVILARNEDDLGRLAAAPTWDRLPAVSRTFRTWTDDYSNIVRAFQFSDD